MKWKHEFKPISEESELEYCFHCFGSEASLTSMCPRTTMTREQNDGVLYGNLDFRGDEGWVVGLSPTGQDMVKSAIFSFYRGNSTRFNSLNEIRIYYGANEQDFKEVLNRVHAYLYSNQVSAVNQRTTDNNRDDLYTKLRKSSLTVVKQRH